VIKSGRQQGLHTEDIFYAALKRFSRLDELAQTRSDQPPCITAFRCRTYQGVSGPNWLIAGEAASMVDPITSNGVTAALRHAAEASELIVRYKDRSELPRIARNLYSKRVLQMAKLFNCGVEQLVYDCTVRDSMGLEKAATIYTAAAWMMNAVYSRLRPRGILSTFLFGALLDILRAGAQMMHRRSRRTTH
jgi:flavin-dependent dehydrogenase